jgi:hypothetical protein
MKARGKRFFGSPHSVNLREETRGTRKSIQNIFLFKRRKQQVVPKILTPTNLYITLVMNFSVHNDLTQQALLLTQLRQSNVTLSNNLQFLLLNVASVAQKGINIDDTTVLLTPSSHNPHQSADTFPFAWNGITSPISSIRTFHYASGVGGKTWVRWAVENGIKVVAG